MAKKYDLSVSRAEAVAMPLNEKFEPRLQPRPLDLGFLRVATSERFFEGMLFRP
jgi:hypothetical protein